MQRSRSTILRRMAAILATAALLGIFIGILNGSGFFHKPPVAVSTSPYLHVKTSSIKNATLPSGFSPFYISPDGNTFVGIIENSDYSPVFVSYSTTTQTTQTLQTFPSGAQIVDPNFDGTYLTWIQEGPGQQVYLKAADVDNNQVRIIANAGDSNAGGSYVLYPGQYQSQIDHGHLFWQEDLSGLSLKLTDLATGLTTTIASSIIPSQSYVTGTTAALRGFQVNWPYVVYSVSVDGTYSVTNVETGATNMLPIRPAPAPNPGTLYYEDGFLISQTASGLAVFDIWITSSGNCLIYELDHADMVNPPGHWHKTSESAQPYYFNLSSSSQLGGVIGSLNADINGRLLVFNGKTISAGDVQQVGFAWDLQLKHLIVFPSGVRLYGNWLDVLSVVKLSEITPQPNSPYVDYFSNNPPPGSLQLIDTQHLQIG